MKKTLKVIIAAIVAALSIGAFSFGACKGVQDERIVEDSGSYISVREL